MMRRILLGVFSLVQNDQYSARKVVRNEAEWARVYQTWKTGVVLLYPHHLNKLNTYHDMVIELFRAAPYEPSVAINVDAEARDRYACSPYRMDDHSRFQLPLLSQMLCKREAADTMGPLKRAAVPCQNWSLGICSNPCAFRRKHGICSECGGKHKARDHERCLTSLEARHGKELSASHADSRSGNSGRP